MHVSGQKFFPSAFREDDYSDTRFPAPMSPNGKEENELEAAVRAAELGCEAFYLPDKDGERPGKWHFNQKYDEGLKLVTFFGAKLSGIIWKRLRYPWVALRGTANKSYVPAKNLSKQLRSAETYLKTAFPNALIPRSLLKETLQDSYPNLEETYNAAQGQLLDLGITRYIRQKGSGHRIGGQWKRLCIAFSSGELRTDVCMSPKVTIADLHSYCIHSMVREK